MKSQWTFRFECKGFTLDVAQKFGGYIDREAVVASDMTPQKPDFLLAIEPEEGGINLDTRQFGKLTIVLSGDKKQTEEMAYWIAEHASEYISLFNGELKISYGFVAGEYLPETPEEEESLGDRRHFFTVRLVKKASPRKFDETAIQRFTLDSSLHPMLKQFNTALAANSPVDQFVGLFKILEDYYSERSDRKGIASRLKRSKELSKISRRYLRMRNRNSSKALTQNDYFHLIDELVSVRHQCAHLKSKQGFGISHGDPRIRQKVSPLIVPLRRLTLEAIRIRLGSV
jgi:hypothetical protein